MMLFAENVIQIDIAGVVTIVGAILAGLGGGLAGAARLFVGYMQAKDDRHEADREAREQKHEADLRAIIERLEIMIAASDSKDAKHDAEFRLLYDGLMKLHGETARTVTEQVAAMRTLGATMDEVKHAIAQLTERLGRVEKVTPPHKHGG